MRVEFIRMLPCVSLIAIVLTGCAAVYQQGGKQTNKTINKCWQQLGYKAATREQMLAEVVPAFSLLTEAERASVPDFGRNALIGRWSASRTSNSRHALLKQGMLGPLTTGVHEQTNTFFEDGTYQMRILESGKETNSSGEWEYNNGILTVITRDASQRKTRFSLEIIWLTCDSFVMRIADIPDHERLCTGSSVKSCHCHYDNDWLFRTQMILKDDRGDEVSAITIVESPWISERIAEK